MATMTKLEQAIVVITLIAMAWVIFNNHYQHLIWVGFGFVKR